MGCLKEKPRLLSLNPLKHFFGSKIDKNRPFRAILVSGGTVGIAQIGQSYFQALTDT